MCLREALHAVPQDCDCESWKPVKITKCQDHCCRETNFLVENIADLIHSSIRTNSTTIKTGRKALGQFSEHDRILSDNSLSGAEKAELLCVPTRRGIRKFLSHFVKICELKPEILVSAMIILNKFLRQSSIILLPDTWRILFILAVRITKKVEGHSLLSSFDLSYVYPLFRPREFIKMECRFLKTVKYQLHISQEHFRSHCLFLLNEDR
mmetsp:Transcript_18364/g.20834  ORF Transcript_18364/g.20834 Transcript_18364/m.20834 type:complete len:209 (+) Transcript_18364:82-708(+)